MTLKNKVQEIDNIKNDIVSCYTNLKNILISKNVEIDERDKLRNLIDRISKLSFYTTPIYIYNRGNECVDVSGGWIKELTPTEGDPITVLEGNRIDCIYARHDREYTGSYRREGNAKFVTTNYIDFSKFDELAVKCSSNVGRTDYNASSYFKLIDQQGEVAYSNGGNVSINLDSVIDITNLKGKYKIELTANFVTRSQTYGLYLRLDKVLLKPKLPTGTEM